MGGGYVSKDKFLDDENKLLHYFNVPNYPLCGGTPPIYLSVLDQLKNENVGLIVTLLLEPPHSGRTINHVPFDFDETEWTDGDQQIEEKIVKLGIEVLHIPVQDGCPPTNESIDQLLTGVREFLSRRPNEKIYLHCWKGSGRTSVLLISLLNAIWNVPLDQAENLVRDSNQKCRITEYQRPYLNLGKNPDFPHLSVGLYKEIYDPAIRTPVDHKSKNITNCDNI